MGASERRRIGVRRRGRAARPVRAAGRLAAALLAAIGLAAAGAAWAADEEPARDGSATPSLDRLLKLPDSTAPIAPVSKGGASRQEWAERFARARAELTAAQGRLSAAQDELAELSAGSSAWQVSAPGGQATDTGPLSFELRERIRKGREDVERARTALEDLRIEANLAGVPASWIAEPSEGRGEGAARQPSGAP